MKLRNKKTGEIVEVESLYLTQSQELQLTFTDEKNERKLYMTSKISTFENEWEDYEKPKKYWFIDAFGNIVQNEITKHYGDEYTDMTNAYENQKQIGNYFETKEEAEKAVEKLKAWKRLKDKKFELTEWYKPDGCEPFIVVETNIDYDDVDNKELQKDLDLLFGGEE